MPTTHPILVPRRKDNGRVFTLDDLNDRALTPEYSDEYWADGHSEWGSEEVDHPDEIELVMSAAAAAARITGMSRPPAPICTPWRIEPAIALPILLSNDL